MSKTYCVLPFIHLETRADAGMAPCCISKDLIRDESGEAYSLYQDKMTEAFHSQSMNELRQDLLLGRKNKNCEQCWLEEGSGGESKRQRENKRWERLGTLSEPLEQPLFLDLKLGNLCNLKCRICSPGSSTKWAQEALEMGHGLPTLKTARSKTPMTALQNWPDHNPHFWQELELWLPHITRFEIYGGEPFLSVKHFEILKDSIAKGYSSKQHIHYNTNGTLFPRKAFEDIFPHFKSVDIMLSIDGIGEQFEYQRHLASWPVIEKNLELFRFFLNNNLQICLSVSALNVFYVPDYLEWFEEKKLPVYLNMVYNPSEFDFRHLPEKARTAALAKWKAKNFLCVNPHNYSMFIKLLQGKLSESAKPFLDKIEMHDQFRKESFARTFPEWNDVLQSC